jgi:riboflavin biosynthesis pyrimidine reductase
MSFASWPPAWTVGRSTVAGAPRDRVRTCSSGYTTNSPATPGWSAALPGSAKGKPYPASTKGTLPRTPWFARPDAKAYGIVLDAHGKIGWGRSEIGGDPIVVVLSEAVSDAHLAGLRGEGVSYIFAGKSELDLALTLDILNSELGVKRLLLEGGGGANGAFLRAGLVDELNLILCPAVDGAKGAPSVFDSTDAEADHRAPVTAMTLDSSQALDGGALLLRYRIQNEDPKVVDR